MNKIRSGRLESAVCHALIGIAVLSVNAASLAAQSPAAIEQRSYSIPAGPLDAVLNQYAVQSQIALTFDPLDIPRHESSGLAGAYTVDEGFAILLRDTNLIARFRSDSNSYVVERSNARVQELIVTGSRIRRDDADVLVPVAVVDSEKIQRMGLGNVADILQRLPALGIGTSPTAFSLGGEVGTHYANLRGLGQGRTLTLINGRRRVAGGSSSSAVDLSTIPASMIDRIEVITGGASAVYGADAVSGVLNVILKQDIDGLTLDARTYQPGFDGGEAYSLALSAGTPFADERGSLSLGVNYSKDKRVGNHQVPWLDRKGYPSFVANPANTGPNDGIADFINVGNIRIRPLHYAGAFSIGGNLYTVDPTLRLIQNDRIVSGTGIGGDGGDPNDWNTYKAGSESTTLLGSLRYELSPAIELFVDANVSSAKANAPWAADLGFGMPIGRDNPYIPADLGELMDANGLTELSVSRMHLDHGLRDDTAQHDTYTVVTGLQGEFRGWSWQAFYQYGRYDRRYRGENYRLTGRFLEAIDAVLDPATNTVVCRSASARAAGCLPINILGRGAPSSAALAYFQHTILRDLVNTQSVAGAQLTGDLFDLPAGPVKLASGIEYRDESISTRDDGALLLGLINQGTGSQPIDARLDVAEVFAEVAVPLLADKPFAHRLDVEGAVRLSDYDTVGSTTTWKLGAGWAPTDALKFRVMRAKSVRAPNLVELFNPGTTSYGTSFDPCDAANINFGSSTRLANCRAAGVPVGWVSPRPGSAANTLTGGNPNLDPERSDSWTAGLVFTPGFAPGLSAAIDYWKIDIEEAIEPFDSLDIVTRCYDSDSLNNPFCPLLTRGTSLDLSEIALINVTNANIGRLSTDGVDFTTTFSFGARSLVDGWRGDVHLSLLGTYLNSSEQQVDPQDPSTLLISTGEVAYPKWRGSFSAAYDLEAFSVGWTLRYVGASRFDVQAPKELYSPSGGGARIYNDLVGTFRLGRKYEAYLGVNNLLDAEPPYTPNTFSGVPAGFYDLLGRTFFAGVRLQL